MPETNKPERNQAMAWFGAAALVIFSVAMITVFNSTEIGTQFNSLMGRKPKDLARDVTFVPDRPSKLVLPRRKTGSGQGWLEAYDLELKKLNRLITIQILGVCRFEKTDSSWQPVSTKYQKTISLKPDAQDRKVFEAPEKPGLYKLRFAEFIEGNAKGEIFTDYLVSGPVLCNDIHLGPSPEGQKAICIPFADHAEAAFVPIDAEACFAKQAQ